MLVDIQAYRITSNKAHMLHLCVDVCIVGSVSPYQFVPRCSVGGRFAVGSIVNPFVDYVSHVLLDISRSVGCKSARSIVVALVATACYSGVGWAKPERVANFCSILF